MRSTYIIIATVCWGLWPSLAASKSDCGSWNTWAFFENATEEDVARCVASGADPRAPDQDGMTPLHAAAEKSKTPGVVVTLLNAGANLEARDRDEMTPLHAAAATSVTPDVIVALLNAGADLKARDKGGATPLQWAAAVGKTPAVVLTF